MDDGYYSASTFDAVCLFNISTGQEIRSICVVAHLAVIVGVVACNGLLRQWYGDAHTGIFILVLDEVSKPLPCARVNDPLSDYGN